MEITIVDYSIGDMQMYMFPRLASTHLTTVQFKSKFKFNCKITFENGRKLQISAGHRISLRGGWGGGMSPIPEGEYQPII